MSPLSDRATASGRPRSPAADKPLLELRGLRVEYLSARGGVAAADGVSFSVAAGEAFGLAGESGCGKSTVANSVLRILRPPAVITGGEILYEGRDVLAMGPEELQAFRWREASMVFQSAMSSLNPVLRIEEQIVDVIARHEALPRPAARERAAALLKTVGIDPGRLRAYPHELSGGMRQRVGIAIALALEPPLMILDEPTTALDVVVQKDILGQIEGLKREMGFSILFISHDLSLMVEFTDRIGIMYAGTLVELAPAREIFERPLHPYTEGLLASFPPLSGAKTRLAGIPGAPPDLAAPPGGCRFHPRCPKALPICSSERPAILEAGAGRQVACHLAAGGRS